MTSNPAIETIGYLYPIVLIAMITGLIFYGYYLYLDWKEKKR